MPVKIEFSTANAAFAEGSGEVEIVRILQGIELNIMALKDNGPVRDSNGNTIGQWSATIDAEDEE